MYTVSFAGGSSHFYSETAYKICRVSATVKSASNFSLKSRNVE